MTNMEEKDITHDDLRLMNFYGEVVDINDPEKRGRAKVRVFGKFDTLDDSDIPWAEQSAGTTFGSGGGTGMLSVPRLGTVVRVYFDNGKIYAPIYQNVLEPAPDLLREISESYEGAHSLIYDGDEDLKVFYTRESGLKLELKGSIVNIASDNSITIEHAGTSAIIELRGGTCTITTDSEIEMTAGSRIKATAPEVWVDGRETKTGHVPAYSQVLGEPLFTFLAALSNAVDAKLYPSPGAMSSACQQARQLSLSDTCKVSK
jgi:hypothetical protein